MADPAACPTWCTKHVVDEDAAGAVTYVEHAHRLSSLVEAVRTVTITPGSTSTDNEVHVGVAELSLADLEPFLATVRAAGRLLRSDGHSNLERDHTLQDVAAALQVSTRWVRDRIRLDGAAHQRYGTKIRFTTDQVAALRTMHAARLATLPITTGRKKGASTSQTGVTK
jgi:hypothetical protein